MGFLDSDGIKPSTDSIEELREYYSRQLDVAERYLIPKIVGGDVGAKRSLLSLVANTIFECGYFPPKTSALIARGLEQIAQDMGDLRAPFGIRRSGPGARRHHIAVKSAQVDFRRAYAVEYLRHMGDTLDNAIAKVAERLSISEETVKGAWKRKHKPAMEEIRLQQLHFGRLVLPPSI